MNRALSVKVFQLNNLFDISRELTASLDEEAIKRLVVTTLMGHFLASRCALYLLAGEGLALAHARGWRTGEVPARLPAECAAQAEELPGSPAHERAARDCCGRRSPRPGSRWSFPSPREAARAGCSWWASAPRARRSWRRTSTSPRLSRRQAQAALEGVRLHRWRSRRSDRTASSQIAREIQRSLFPRKVPAPAELELAAESRPCFQVGGDYYDFIPLDGERLALVVADVSGKGTPASILMASVHASLRALAGAEPPARLMERLNRFLFASTQESKYVTLFYGEIEPRAREASVRERRARPSLPAARGGRGRAPGVGRPRARAARGRPLRGGRRRPRFRRPPGDRDRRGHRGPLARRRGVRRRPGSPRPSGSRLRGGDGSAGPRHRGR